MKFNGDMRLLRVSNVRPLKLFRVFTDAVRHMQELFNFDIIKSGQQSKLQVPMTHTDNHYPQTFYLRSSFEFGARRSPAIRARTPTTLENANTECHEKASSRNPETSRPSRALAPATPAQIETARSRSPAGNTLVMIDS